jgi:hypothetical protein
MLRWFLVALGTAIWAVGLYLLVDGSYGLGGGLMIGGGLCLVIAASGGWTQFLEGLGNWLLFWQ